MNPPDAVAVYRSMTSEVRIVVEAVELPGLVKLRAEVRDDSGGVLRTWGAWPLAPGQILRLEVGDVRVLRHQVLT